MDADLYTLAYFSKSNIADMLIDAGDDINNILVSSRRRNSRLHVTGALLFSEAHFFQVLEGSKGALDDVFGRIRIDGRHRDVNLFQFRSTSERLFPGWSMAFVNLREDCMPNPLFKDSLLGAEGFDDAAAFQDLARVLRALVAETGEGQPLRH